MGQTLERVLVVAPHADDEAFGCGGTIAKLVAQGVTVELLVGALGASDKLAAIRLKELKKAQAILGISKFSVLVPDGDGRLDQIDQIRLVAGIEWAIHESNADTVIYPYPSHHQDHRAIEQACVAALRPGTHNVQVILMYEYTYPAWGPASIPGGRLYEDIEKTMGKKMGAIRAYGSQLRPEPHPVSMWAAEAMAMARGIAVGLKYAELFYVVQMKDVL